MILQQDSQSKSIQQRQNQQQSYRNRKQRSRSRSRQKKPKGEYFTKEAQALQNKSRRYKDKQLKGGQLSYKQYLAKQQQFHENQQLIRSFLRIQQSRQQPIDKFVKILYIYKGKYAFDHKLIEVMVQPKKYLNSLTINQLQQMIPQAEIHLKSQKNTETQFIQFWKSLINLIKYKIIKKNQTQSPITKQLKPQVKQIMKKSVQQLTDLQKIHKLMILTGGSDSQIQYWKALLQKIKAKKLELKMIAFYEQYLKQNPEAIKKQEEQSNNEQFINASPNLIAQRVHITQKMITNSQEDIKFRSQLAQRIFKEQFQKGKQKLEINLSVPKNQQFSTTNIISQSTNTYDYITKQILEFQKYKRLEDDQQEFHDQVNVQTQGRFRDRKAVYINRVRKGQDWTRVNKYSDNPPPKTVQGYKFTIFYPDLLDKQKTPQYYLTPLQNSDYCLITFKAGPPYKDLAFKIIKKEWDFSKKSGFQSIFAKGILHLYFNFKKPRYWI